MKRTTENVPSLDEFSNVVVIHSAIMDKLKSVPYAINISGGLDIIKDENGIKVVCDEPTYIICNDCYTQVHSQDYFVKTFSFFNICVFVEFTDVENGKIVFYLSNYVPSASKRRIYLGTIRPDGLHTFITSGIKKGGVILDKCKTFVLSAKNNRNIYVI